jgi:hypothetical protein
MQDLVLSAVDLIVYIALAFVVGILVGIGLSKCSGSFLCCAIPYKVGAVTGNDDHKVVNTVALAETPSYMPEPRSNGVLADGGATQTAPSPNQRKLNSGEANTDTAADGHEGQQDDLENGRAGPLTDQTQPRVKKDEQRLPDFTDDGKHRTAAGNRDHNYTREKENENEKVKEKPKSHEGKEKEEMTVTDIASGIMSGELQEWRGSEGKGSPGTSPIQAYKQTRQQVVKVTQLSSNSNSNSSSSSNFHAKSGDAASPPKPVYLQYDNAHAVMSSSPTSPHLTLNPQSSARASASASVNGSVLSENECEYETHVLAEIREGVDEQVLFCVHEKGMKNVNIVAYLPVLAESRVEYAASILQCKRVYLEQAHTPGSPSSRSPVFLTDVHPLELQSIYGFRVVFNKEREFPLIHELSYMGLAGKLVGSVCLQLPLLKGVILDVWRKPGGPTWVTTTCSGVRFAVVERIECTWDDKLYTVPEVSVIARHLVTHVLVKQTYRYA